MTHLDHNPKSNNKPSDAPNGKSDVLWQTATDESDAQRQFRKTAEQNAQARLVLIQLLWLAIVLIVGACFYLADKQTKLEQSVDERLKITETFTSRMNDMDDRIFAMSPSVNHDEKRQGERNDLQLISIQLDAANRLYQDGDYLPASEILKSIEWQLSNEQVSMAAPLKSSLKTTLKDDLASLALLQKQIDPWQQDSVSLREIQSFLRTLDNSNEALTRKNLLIHDADMLLSLTISATSMHEREVMVVHLNEVSVKLNELKKISPAPSNTDVESTTPKTDVMSKHEASIKTQGINTLDEAIFAANELLANPPSLPPLSSIEILKGQ